MRRPLHVSQRDIILVPFPFSDLSGSKVRPVLVLSNDAFDMQGDDVIVCAITSRQVKTAHALRLDLNDIESGVLHMSCSVKVESIFKMDKSLVIKSIGRVRQEFFKDVLRMLGTLFE